LVSSVGIPGEVPPATPTNESFSPNSNPASLPAVIYPWMRRMQAPGKHHSHYHHLL